MVEIKQHDTARTFTDQLYKGDDLIDLSGVGTAVVLIFRDEDGNVVRRDATITDGEEGRVAYSVVADDVATAGIFDLEWEITFGDDTQLSVPTRGYPKLKIIPDLD